MTFEFLFSALLVLRIDANSGLQAHDLACQVPVLLGLSEQDGPTQPRGAYGTLACIEARAPKPAYQRARLGQRARHAR